MSRVFANGSEAGVQSPVESFQRLKKWYLVPPCLTLSIIRLGSRMKLSNPGNGVVPSPTPRCSSYWKGSLRVTLDYCRQLYCFRSKFFLYNGYQKQHFLYWINLFENIFMWGFKFQQKITLKLVFIKIINFLLNEFYFYFLIDGILFFGYR